jgi:cytochrome c-type biogenesis protein
VVAVILMVMGLQLAGLINLKLGGNAQRFLPRRTGLIGALILGMLFDLVLSPCASPVLSNSSP